jgi:hypothetical protein
MDPFVTASLAKIFSHVSQKFLDQFIEDEGYSRLKKYLFPKKKYTNRLTQIIHKTVDEYKRQNEIVIESGKIPFYQSQILFEKLSAHILLKTEYSNEILTLLDNNQNIQKPTKEELNVFFTLLGNKINNDRELRKLHVEENYQNEIFEIADKINRIESKIDTVIENTNEIKTILEGQNLYDEWGKQINIYESLLEEFKPKTALVLVEELEKRLVEKQLDKNIILQAKIEFLKARCYEKTNEQRTNSFQSYIKSYLLNKTNKLYKEKACVSYYVTKDYEAAEILAKEIIEFEPFNPCANAIKILVKKDTVIEELNKISDIVKQNPEFKRLIYVNLREESYFLELFSILQFENTNNYGKEFNSLTEQNFKLYLIEIDVVINSILRNMKIDFFETKIEDKKQLSKLFNLLEIFNKSIENTEIQNEYISLKLYFEFFKFVETKNEQHVFNLFGAYEQLGESERTEFQALIVANSLQQIDKVEEAIKLLNEVTNIKQNVQSILSLKLFCFQKNDDADAFEKTAIEKFELISALDNEIIHDILSTICYLAFLNKLDKFVDFEFKIANENDESTKVLNFINYYTKLISNITKDFDKTIIDATKDTIFFDNHNFKKYIQDAYLITGYFQDCLDVLNLIPQNQKFELEIQNNITALYHLKGNNKELLSLLKYWRENFHYNSMFVRIEIDKVTFINDWKECEIICEYALQNEKNEDFILYFIKALFFNNSKEKASLYLSELKNFEYQKGNVALNVVDFLLRFEYFEEGLELCYKWAKEKDFKPARTFFFTNFNHNIPADFFQFYEDVKSEYFIRYSINNESMKYTKEINSDDFSNNFINLKKGNEVQIKRAYSNDFDTYQILAICNKYMALKLEIIDETINPHSGLGMQSFNLNDYDSPLDIFKELGDPSYNSEEPYEKYYSEEIKFSQLPFFASELNQNFVKTYYKLIFEKNDILKVDPRLFPIFNFKIEYDYILDFTSVLYFFEFSKTNNFQKSKKFKISNLVNVILRTYKEDILNNYVQNEHYTINAKFYDEILNWISENCEEIYPTKLLDLIEENKSNKVENEKNPLFLYLMNQIAMIQEFNNSVLITDDLTFYQIYPLKDFKLMSTDVYILQQTLKSEFGQLFE